MKMNLMEINLFIMFYKGKEYYSVNKWVGIFNKNYKDMGIKVDSHILHHLFNYYKIPHINVNKKGEICKDGGIAMYPVRLVENMMYQKETFIRNLKGIIDYWDEYEIRKEVDERNKLRNNRKSVKISEAAYNRLFENYDIEGFQTNRHGQFMFSPNNKLKADTTIFKQDSKELNVKMMLLPKSKVMSYNLYTLDNMDVSKGLKHKTSLRGDSVKWYSKDDYDNKDVKKTNQYSRTIEHFIKRSCLYMKRIIGNSTVDYITYPQSSSEFNYLITNQLLTMYPNSEGIKLIPQMLVKNVRGVYVNTEVAKQVGLTDDEIHQLMLRVDKWKKDEDIRDLRKEIEILKKEVYDIIKNRGRGRPSKDFVNKQKLIDINNQKIQALRGRGRDSTVDSDGNIKDWQIKSLDEKTRKAIEGIFTINPKYLQLKRKLIGKTIILFDDNISSGATLDDLCLALQQYGVANIIPITLGVIPSTIYRYSERHNKKTELN